MAALWCIRSKHFCLSTRLHQSNWTCFSWSSMMEVRCGWMLLSGSPATRRNKVLTPSCVKTWNLFVPERSSGDLIHPVACSPPSSTLCLLYLSSLSLCLFLSHFLLILCFSPYLPSFLLFSSSFPLPIFLLFPFFLPILFSPFISALTPISLFPFFLTFFYSSLLAIFIFFFAVFPTSPAPSLSVLYFFHFHSFPTFFLLFPPFLCWPPVISPLLF